MIKWMEQIILKIKHHWKRTYQWSNTRKMKQSRTLWGSWAWKPFRQLLIREGGDIETKEGQPRDNSAAWGQDPGSTSRDTHNHACEIFIELNPQQMEDISILHSRENHLKADYRNHRSSWEYRRSDERSVGPVPLPATPEKTLHVDITRGSTPKSDWLYSLQPKIKKLYTVNKNETGSRLWLRSWTPYCQIQTEIEESRKNH